MARRATFADDDLDETREEERPRRSRPVDDDDRPRKRPRRRTFDEDDEEVEERPKGRRPRDSDDDEPERPKRRTRGRPESDDEDGVRPATRTNAARQAAAGGWDNFDALGSGDKGDFEAKNALRLKVSNDPTLLKLLDSAPFDSMGVHWVQEIKSGKRSFRCPGENCSLCDDLDHYARKLAYFNVAAFDEDTEQWENRVWEVGVKLGRKLKALNDDKKRGPIDKPTLYFSISKTGKGTSTEYHLDAVKARDLDEDWGVDEIDEKTYKALNENRFTEQWERISKPEELRRVVKRLLDDSEDDEDDDY
ncbi:hypothetical protein AB0B15_03360 [Streptomyces sp. NPDC045456]|uniref:hypothetical protein n=1 Tax=Streptomyces sp. NPDC045456 TaxID=3155254 RepID=UPI0033C36A92